MEDRTDYKAFNVIVRTLYGGVTRMAHYIYVMYQESKGRLVVD